MGQYLFAAAIMCLLIGLVELFAPEQGVPERRATRRPAAYAAGALASSKQPWRWEAPFSPSGDRAVKPNLQTFAWIEVGQRIYVPHPQQGERMAHVLGKIVFAELWQQSRGPQSPWVPTGAAFAAFWLEGNFLLLNWQNRCYLLDEAEWLSDADIARQFAPYARQFAQSDQTADVYFAYPPASWHIDDIGKFRVEALEGQTLRYRQGGVGRFIHASGAEGRALVVEDFEGGGGQDAAWIGYRIDANQVRQA